jgi:hypothetical protein
LQKTLKIKVLQKTLKSKVCKNAEIKVCKNAEIKSSQKTLNINDFAGQVSG